MDDVTVLQADREAAASLIEEYFPNNEAMLRTAQDYRSGHTQGVWAVAFAHHRHDHTADLLEAVSPLAAERPWVDDNNVVIEFPEEEDARRFLYRVRAAISRARGEATQDQHGGSHGRALGGEEGL